MRWWKSTIAAILMVPVATLAAHGAEVAPADVAFGDEGIEMSLTGAAGDPVAGAETFKSRKEGNCLACHANSGMQDQLFHGNVGPALDGVADRYEAPTLRAIVVNAKKIFTDETVMPGFYSLDVGLHVPEKFAGKTILNAQQVEDIVAYLETLKE